jgi:hypothetical protein
LHNSQYEESLVSQLNENHKRRLYAAFQHMDKLLSQSLNAINPAPLGLYSRYVQDISQSERRQVESHVEKIREKILDLLKRFQIALPPASTPASWVLRTNLTSLDIAFEDLYPEKMKGYGNMAKSTAIELASAIEEIRGLLGQLLAVISEKIPDQKAGD